MMAMDDGTSTNGRGRGRRRRDLVARAFPAVRPDQDPAAALDLLRTWAEGEVEDAIAWYLRDKSVRRASSRVLRAFAIVLGVAGGVVPLLGATGVGKAASWGYVLLAAAGGCLAFDHFFGLSSGWMRDIAASQSLQRALIEFRIEWVTGPLRTDTQAGADDPSHPETELHRRERLIRELVSRTSEVVAAETGEWLVEFRTNVGHLGRQTSWVPPTADAGPNGGGQPADIRGAGSAPN